MYTPDQVKPYLHHNDSIVSNGAIQYFAESFQYPKGLTEELIAKVSEGLLPDAIYLHLAYAFPQTAATASEILDLLSKGTVKGNSRIHLTQMLLGSDSAILSPLLDKLKQLSPDAGIKAEEHIRIGQMNPQELKEAFEQMIAASRGLDYGDLEFDYLDYMASEVAKKAAFTPDEVIDKLDSAEPDNTENYEPVYFAQVAGRMKLKAAVPQLIDFLGASNDLLAEQACDALVRIASDEAVSKLAARYQTEQDDYFKLYAADCLGRIPAPSAESAVIGLLQKERNLTHATKLAGSLCFMGSKQSIPVVAKLIETGYDDEFLDLREPLYINCIINDVSLPQLEGWRKTFL